jgi:hypothetical protein
MKRKGTRKSHKWRPSTCSWECAARLLCWPLSNKLSHRKGCKPLPETRLSSRSSLPELLGRKTFATRPASADVGVREGMPYAGAQEGRSTISDSETGGAHCRVVSCTMHARTNLSLREKKKKVLSEWCRRGTAHAWVCVSKTHVLKKEPPDPGRGSARRESGISMVSASDGATRHELRKRRARGTFVPVAAPAGQ